jgi:hypothetical protein
MKPSEYKYKKFINIAEEKKMDIIEEFDIASSFLELKYKHNIFMLTIFCRLCDAKIEYKTHNSNLDYIFRIQSKIMKKLDILHYKTRISILNNRKLYYRTHVDLKKLRCALKFDIKSEYRIILKEFIVITEKLLFLLIPKI